MTAMERNALCPQVAELGLNVQCRSLSVGVLWAESSILALVDLLYWNSAPTLSPLCIRSIAAARSGATVS
jgi:hypothetical protein